MDAILALAAIAWTVVSLTALSWVIDVLKRLVQLLDIVIQREKNKPSPTRLQHPGHFGPKD
jgi:hypothetical protein